MQSGNNSEIEWIVLRKSGSIRSNHCCSLIIICSKATGKRWWTFYPF